MMTVNLFHFVCRKDIQLHVLILCTPNPLWCAVLLAPTHSKHGIPIMLLLLVCCQKVMCYFGESVMILEDFIVFSVLFWVFLLPFPSSIALETLFRECRPPSHFPPQNPHAYQFMHTDAHRNLHPATCLIPNFSHSYHKYSETQPPAQNPHPLIPLSFVRGNHQTQLIHIHSTRDPFWRQPWLHSAINTWNGPKTAKLSDSRRESTSRYLEQSGKLHR